MSWQHVFGERMYFSSGFSCTRNPFCQYLSTDAQDNLNFLAAFD